MEETRNPGCDLDLNWVQSVRVSRSAVEQRVAALQASRAVKGKCRAGWLLKAVTLIDLTTLSGDDTASNVARLCSKASHPLCSDVLNGLGVPPDTLVHTAAVCVYPARVKDGAMSLQHLGMSDHIAVASVATGFPSGQYPLSTRLAEIACAVSQGATEIDVVVDRSLVLAQNWVELHRELRAMREACGRAHLKVILAAGELGCLAAVQRAALVAMMSGADFVKTSTGKEAVNATLPIGLVMCRAIRDYHFRTGYKVGLKPAGGIRTAENALAWLVLVKEELGRDWLKPSLFRIGASGLLTDIEHELYQFVTGRRAASYEFSLG